MKVVYGNPKTIMTIGMALIGDVPTPFIGFVDKAKMEGDPAFALGSNSLELTSKIDAVGGVIIYIENPDAAERLSKHMLHLFEAALESDWGDIEQVEAELQ